MSGEHREGRVAIDRMVERQRDSAREAGQPFDHKQARDKARDAAIRHDQRKDGTRKGPK